MMEPLLTLKDVTALLRVSQWTVFRMVKAGRFPAPLKVSGALRWSLADVQGWLDSVRSAGADGR